MGGDLAKELDYRYGPPMPCGLRQAASVVLDSRRIRGIEEPIFPVHGLSSQAVHPVAQRGEQAAAGGEPSGRS